MLLNNLRLTYRYVNLCCLTHVTIHNASLLMTNTAGGNTFAHLLAHENCFVHADDEDAHRPVFRPVQSCGASAADRIRKEDGGSLPEMRRNVGAAGLCFCPCSEFSAVFTRRAKLPQKTLKFRWFCIAVKWLLPSSSIEQRWWSYDVQPRFPLRSALKISAALFHDRGSFNSPAACFLCSDVRTSAPTVLHLASHVFCFGAYCVAPRVTCVLLCPAIIL